MILDEETFGWLPGFWQSTASTIPDYISGREWLCFKSDGKHLWIIQRGADSLKPRKISFTFEQHEKQVLFCVCSEGSERSQLRWEIRINAKNADEIEIIPQHGHRTLFRRIYPETEEWALLRKIAL